MSILSVLSPVPIGPTAATEDKINNATDHFIRDRLPDWLRKATPAQINLLRDRFAAHHAAQNHVQERLARLVPIDRFAETRLSAAVAGWLSEPVALAELEWCEVRRSFKPDLGIGLPSDTFHVVRQPALLRLMQNFHEGATFYEGTGLARAGQTPILSGDADTLAASVRALNIGARYQDHLNALFTAETLNALGQEKHAAFALCAHMAWMRGVLNAAEANALQRLLGASLPGDDAAVTAYPGTLKMLDASIEDGLTIQLRGPEGEDQGVLLYLPQDTNQPLRRFATSQAMNAALTSELKDPVYQRRFSQRVGLAQRGAFLERLALRLKDAHSDLEIEGVTVAQNLFSHMATQQAQRVKADAGLLLVANADADRAASAARLKRWETLGLDLLNLAGLFVPAIGAVLLTQLVVQTASEAYEGIMHWRRGHQHEALQHLLGVAETVAVTAAAAVGVTVIARGFTRSVFVDGLEPVLTQDQRQRLWHRDLEPFVERPDAARLQADGRFSDGERYWIRVEGRFYRIHQPEPGRAWRLKHPLGEGAFEPIVEFNGERSWRLRDHRPLEWNDTAQMLDTLWPHDPPLTGARAERTLRIAGMDKDELRGLLVEHRRTPCNLKWALQGCAADQRIETFYDELAHVERPSDTALLDWCRVHLRLAHLGDAELRDVLIERQSGMRLRLFEHLTASQPSSDPLHALVKRDFPGLPDLYVQAVLEPALDAERTLANAEQRLPLAWATRARALLQLARLNKALAGLYLHNTYVRETGDLVMALLRRVPWPRRLNLELRDGRDGALLARLDPAAPQEALVVMAREEDGFHLYDERGLEHEAPVQAPRTIFQALVALLSPKELEALGCQAQTAAEDLRRVLLEHLPAEQARVRQLAGWTPEPAWFNPGQRLPDGRVGYALSGRAPAGSSTRRMLRERIRRLYWGFTEQQVDSYLNMLMRSPGSSFDILLAQELNYQQLDDALNTWAAASGQPSVRAVRRSLSEALRRCWRLQGTMVFSASGEVEGMALDLSEYAAGALPELPERTDMGHVSQLTLARMNLRDVPSEFLRSFIALQHLDLSSNRLTQIPTGLARLPALRSVRLAYNRIVYTEQLTDPLYGLRSLRFVDLRFNPLGRFWWRYNPHVRLNTLLLAHTQLQEWPGGLLECAYLEFVDLRFNQIRALPSGILGMRLSYRRAFQVDENLLSAQDVERLAARAPEAVRQDLETAHDAAATRALWLSGLSSGNQSQRIALWDRVSALPGSSGFITLLGELGRSADYSQAREELRSQVWQLLERVDTDGDLREDLFARAGEERTCADCSADRFAELRLLVMVFDAHRVTGPRREQTLVNLGRRLFRLDRLNQFIRADIALRLASGRDVDEVEVSLAYRINLAQELELPGQPEHMLFEQIANVSLVDLDDAVETVRAAERSWELADNLSRRSFWRSYLEENHPAAFASVRERFATLGSELDDQMDVLTSEQYRERWRLLDNEREAALQAIVLRLTEEALVRHPLG